MNTTKTICLVTTLLITSLFLISCGEIKKSDMKDDSVITDSNPPSFADTISLDTFYRWVDSWRDEGQAFTAETLVRYFTLDKDDLENVLAENISKSRFYLGLDTLTASPTPHLIVVGVDSRGNDMLDYSNGEYAYDVSMPCPPICGGHN